MIRPLVLFYILFSIQNACWTTGQFPQIHMIFVTLCDVNCQYILDNIILKIIYHTFSSSSFDKQLYSTFIYVIMLKYVFLYYYLSIYILYNISTYYLTTFLVRVCIMREISSERGLICSIQPTWRSRHTFEFRAGLACAAQTKTKIQNCGGNVG